MKVIHDESKGEEISEWNFGAFNFPKREQWMNWRIYALASKKGPNEKDDRHFIMLDSP